MLTKRSVQVLLVASSAASPAAWAQDEAGPPGNRPQQFQVAKAAAMTVLALPIDSTMLAPAPAPAPSAAAVPAVQAAQEADAHRDLLEAYGRLLLAYGRYLKLKLAGEPFIAKNEQGGPGAIELCVSVEGADPAKIHAPFAVRTWSNSYAAVAKCQVDFKDLEACKEEFEALIEKAGHQQLTSIRVESLGAVGLQGRYALWAAVAPPPAPTTDSAPAR
jgi:hypothetical protein